MVEHHVAWQPVATGTAPSTGKSTFAILSRNHNIVTVCMKFTLKRHQMDVVGGRSFGATGSVTSFIEYTANKELVDRLL